VGTERSPIPQLTSDRGPARHRVPLDETAATSSISTAVGLARTIITMAGCLGAGAIAVTPAQAKTVSIKQDGAHLTVRCDGTTVVHVLGAAARVNTTGTCRAIVVNGAGCRVNATVVDRIVINGSSSRVVYRRAGDGGRAMVTINGVGARVFRKA
jgi:hypothetical protein